MDKEDLVVVRQVGQLTKTLLCIQQDFFKLLGAMADLDNRDAQALKIEKFFANAFHHRNRQHRRTCTKIINLLRHEILLP